MSALAVFDDGTGPWLYAAGSFTGLNGQAASRGARWDGVAWSALGTGLSSSAHCLIVHDDGTGTALFVGGNFTTAGGIPSQKVARWRGGAWSAAALPDNPFGGEVATFAEYDDGTDTHQRYAVLHPRGLQLDERLDRRLDAVSWGDLSTFVDGFGACQRF